MRTLTLFSTTQLVGSLQILPVLFHRVNSPDQVKDEHVAQLVRAGGARPTVSFALGIPAAAPLAALAEAIERQLTPVPVQIILDHATGQLFLDRTRDGRREIRPAGLIQEAFMTRFRADITRIGTLAVAFETGAPAILCRCIADAIPSMSVDEARVALTRTKVIMRFEHLMTLLVKAIGLAAERHVAINAGEIADDQPLLPTGILSGLVIDPLHLGQAAA